MLLVISVVILVLIRWVVVCALLFLDLEGAASPGATPLWQMSLKHT